jgi:hypothetical protein
MGRGITACTEKRVVIAFLARLVVRNHLPSINQTSLWLGAWTPTLRTALPVLRFKRRFGFRLSQL